MRPLAFDHLQMHQLAGRVVDIDQQSALRPATLKPPVLRAIDLDQLAATVPTVTGLVRTRAASIAVLLRHEKPPRLCTHAL